MKIRVVGTRKVTERGLASSSIASVAEAPIDSFQSAYDRAKPFSNIPGPRGLPFIGNILDYRFGRLERCHEIIADRYRRYGPLVRENLAGRHVVRVFDPEDVKTIFQNESKIPTITPLQETVQLYRKMRDLSLGLGNLNGDEWYRLRSAVQQAMMRPPAALAYLPLVENVAADFVNYIRRRRSSDTLEVPDFKQVAAKWSLESSGMLVFEKRLGSLSGGDSEKWAEQMVDANTEMFRLTGILKFSFPFYRLIATPKWRRLVRVEDYVYGESRRLVQETIDAILTSKGEMDGRKFNFLAYLLTRGELTRKDVFILSLSLFGDGLSTTAPMLIYNLYTLAANPKCQERLYKEVCDNVPKDGAIDSSVLSKMTYLKACVKETFRLFPIGNELSRIPDKNLVLSGYQVPAGTACDINVGLLLTADVYFKQPTSFLPERWLRDERETESTQSVHPYLMLPFGHGPRMCAGEDVDLRNRTCTSFFRDWFKISSSLNSAVTLYNSESRRTPDGKCVPRIVILVTDGRNNVGNVQPQLPAQQLQAMGVTVYAVGIGPDVSPPQLNKITGSKDRVFTSDFDSLQSIVDQLLAKLCQSHDDSCSTGTTFTTQPYTLPGGTPTKEKSHGHSHPPHMSSSGPPHPSHPAHPSHPTTPIHPSHPPQAQNPGNQ